MKRTYLLCILVMLILKLSAQTPQYFQYQAVVRDASGTALVNQPVNFQISIISGSISGPVIYTETHSASTNAYGIVTLNVGSGVVVTGIFSAINWGSTTHFIKVEADPTGGTSYLDMGTTQLLSVPYALYSEQAGNIPVYTGGTGIDVTGTTITNTSPDQTVTLTQGGATTVSGTYPNFTISSSDLNTGTPGGLNKTIQFNNAGVFDGDTALIWDNTNQRLGVGITNPSGRMVIQGSTTAPDSVPLFEIKNKNGQQIMVVYNDSIQFFITDDAIASNRGGFAVSGRNNAKSFTNDYLKVRPDSTRIYTTDTVTGFGVKNIGLTSKTSYMKLTPYNYFIGHEAGLVTTGLYNSFIGYQSGYNNAIGYQNYFIGYRSGYHNLRGFSNVFLGDSVGFTNTDGARNVMIGNQSGFSNVFGHFNVFIGFKTGSSNVASYNVFIGYESGRNNISGTYNVANGFQALYSNISGGFNVANGYKSLYSNTTGSSNTANGHESLFSNTIGNDNTAYGYLSLYSNTSGFYNTANGYYSLYSNTTGSNNTANGMQALYSNTNGIDNTANGMQALYSNTTGSDNIANGTASLYSNINGNNNVANGPYSLYLNTSGNDNTATGFSSLRSNTSGFSNSATGFYSLYSNSTGNSNTSIGYSSLYSNTTGNGNTANGTGSLFSNNIGTNNTAIGYLAFNTGANFNNSTALGSNTVINQSNKVRIGDVNVTVIEGQVAYTFPSDGRFKNNVTEDVKGLDFIKKLRPVVYNFDTKKFDSFLMHNMPDSIREAIMSKKDYIESSAIRQTGFIAQEIEQAAKESGFDFNGLHIPENENDNYSVAYSLFTVPLVKAVQEQQIIIENQNLKINDLQKQIDELKSLINK